jgi:hypothetical protein
MNTDSILSGHIHHTVLDRSNNGTAGLNPLFNAVFAFSQIILSET